MWILTCYTVCVISLIFSSGVLGRRLLRSVDQYAQDKASVSNSAEFIWGTTTVAVGDTAVLHCSFDAILQQLRTGNINWMKEATNVDSSQLDKFISLETLDGSSTWIASGKKIMTDDLRYRVYRPRGSALSVLIVREAQRSDTGVYRCNLSGSSTRHKFMILNVTESKIEAQTSPATLRARVGAEVTLWCNATGYPKPVVYWTREDRNRRLPDGSYQFWGNGLQIRGLAERDSGVYSCFLDNFVQPIVSYKFSLMVEDNQWGLEGYKMRYDSKRWHDLDALEPQPVRDRSFLLMCQARGSSDPHPVIRWYRNNKLVHPGRHFYLINNAARSNAGFISSTLVIMNYQEKFQGNYTCVASNVYRMKKLTFFIQDTLDTSTSGLAGEDGTDFEKGELLLTGDAVKMKEKQQSSKNKVQNKVQTTETSTAQNGERKQQLEKNLHANNGKHDSRKASEPFDPVKTQLNDNQSSKSNLSKEERKKEDREKGEKEEKKSDLDFAEDYENLSEEYDDDDEDLS